jgi:hypothetical protein
MLLMHSSAAQMVGVLVAVFSSRMQGDKQHTLTCRYAAAGVDSE